MKGMFDGYPAPDPLVNLGDPVDEFPHRPYIELRWDDDVGLVIVNELPDF